jgi:hypothetical protein
MAQGGKCSSCIDKPGHRYRVVDCVKRPPLENSEDTSLEKMNAGNSSLLRNNHAPATNLVVICLRNVVSLDDELFFFLESILREKILPQIVKAKQTKCKRII